VADVVTAIESVGAPGDAAAEQRPRGEERPRRERSGGGRREREPGERTRDIAESRAPGDAERGKRKPRRDRSAIARDAEGEPAGERPKRPTEPALAAQANAEIIDVTPDVASLFPERGQASEPVRAANDPRVPRSVPTAVTTAPEEPSEIAVAAEPELAEETSTAEEEHHAAAVPMEPRPTAVSEPITPVFKPAPAPEQQGGRAYNDPREVRRREREAQLRREGVLKQDGNG